MIEATFKPILSDLDPLIISAPTIRSGTTLLQRLLCSSSKALIYGELCAQDFEFFLNLYAVKSQQYQTRSHEVTAALETVLAGSANDWIPTLMPDLSGYLEALCRGAFSGMSYCRDYAKSVGRPVWGFKYPGWNPAMIGLLRAIMPQARFVFIHRELKDCLKSAKAHSKAFGSAFGKTEVEQFCRSWAGNRQYMLSLEGDPNVLSVQFEKLLSEPQQSLKRLAEFTGVEDIDPNVLKRKVNAWQSSVFITPVKDGYSAPDELDEFDWQVVNAVQSPAVVPAAVC
jgi:hypothetical protein